MPAQQSGNSHRSITMSCKAVGSCALPSPLDWGEGVRGCALALADTPTQPIATRPLALQKDGTWYSYGWDLTKNICEVFGTDGYIKTAYSYTPYGAVTEEGVVTQPIQWSSEYHDSELALVYYNYRHYNPTDGRWTGRDFLSENSDPRLYCYTANRPVIDCDILGMEHKQHGVKAFNQLGNKLAALCDKKCCESGQFDDCKNKAKRIALSILLTWVNEYGKGINNTHDNVGGYLCWDWAVAFHIIGNIEGYPVWSSERIRIREVNKSPATKASDRVHFFVRLCACNCKKDECCLDIDDGWFDNNFIHIPPKWYANEPNDNDSEYDWTVDVQDQGIPVEKFQRIPISLQDLEQ